MIVCTTYKIDNNFNRVIYKIMIPIDEITFYGPYFMNEYYELMTIIHYKNKIVRVFETTEQIADQINKK